MFRSIILSFTLTCASALCMGATGPAPVTSNTEYTVAQIRADLTHLYENLQRGSYNLFANTPQTEYDIAFDTYLKSISQPLSPLEVHKLFMRFTALAGIAHTRVDFPIFAFREFVQNGGRTLPYEFDLSDGQIVISANYGGLKQVQVGDMLVAVNGQAAKPWLQTLLTYLSADDESLARVIAEPMLSPLLWLVDGEQEHYLITLQRGDAAPFTVKQPTVSYSAQVDVASEERLDDNSVETTPREYRMLDQIGYLKTGAFYNIDADSEADVWQTDAFVEFIDDAFETFIEAQAEAIVIDLRNNSGGSNSFSDYLIAWFADRPFRFASEFRVKISDLAQAANEVRLKPNDTEDSVNRQLDRLYQNHQRGEVVLMPLLDSRPHDQSKSIVDKNIPIYVLINRYSYSNAVSVAAIVQDYDFATVIGEATADYATTYAAMEHFRLPHTNIKVGFPKAHIIRPNGDATPSGVTPDVKLNCGDELACVLRFVHNHSSQQSALMSGHNARHKFVNEEITQPVHYNLTTTEGVDAGQYNEALTFAQRQLKELLSLEFNALPKLNVLITKTSEDREQYSNQELTKPFLLLSEDLLLQKKGGRVNLSDVVAHEACHLWLISLAEEKGIPQLKKALPNYGHGEFNDWFDEMVAVSCEGEALQQQRIEQNFELIPLKKYLTQQHPVYEQLQAQIAEALAARNPKGESPQTVIKMTVDKPDFGRYYRQSALFYVFLQSRHQQLKTDEWFTIAQAKSPEKQAKGLGYPTIRELEQAFLNFISEWKQSISK